MVERHIRLNETEDVKEFVNEAAKCDFDIDISYNRIIIDAKSHFRYSEHGSYKGTDSKMLRREQEIQ